MAKNSFRPSPCPLPSRKGVETVSGGHPQTPDKGAKPPCNPLLLNGLKYASFFLFRCYGIMSGIRGTLYVLKGLKLNPIKEEG